MLLALGAALVLVGPSFAQTPTEETAPNPQIVGEMSGIATEPCCGDAGECCPGSPWWVSGELLVGWMQRQNLPTLVTTSLPGTAQASAGVLGLNTTRSLFTDPVNDDGRFGFRLGTGYWLDCDHNFGIDAGFMMLDDNSTSFAASSKGDPILARPFFNVLTNKQDAQLIAFPGSNTGAIKINAESGNYYDFHLDFEGNVCDCCGCRLDALLGYRFYRYDEGLRIGTAEAPTGATFVPGTEIVTVDQFETQNQFNGIDFGLKGHFCWCDLSLDLLGKLAVGNLQRQVNIRGSQIVTVPGANKVENTGGLLALSSNIGNHDSGDWTCLPEFGATLSYKVFGNTRLYAGYSLLYLEDIARAGQQVDVRVNTNLLPPPINGGPQLPAFNLNKTDMWIQTMSFGVEFSF
jgi:Putative beta barrel porin-7 (BBP7)